MATATVTPTSLSGTKPSNTTANFVDGVGTAPTNMQSKDGDTSYRNGNAVANRGDYWACGQSIPSGATNISAVITFTAKPTQAADMNAHIRWKIGSTEYSSSVLTITQGGYADYSSSSISISSVSDANGMLAGYDNLDDGFNSYPIRTTYLEIAFTYTPPAATLSATDMFAMF